MADSSKDELMLRIRRVTAFDKLASAGVAKIEASSAISDAIPVSEADRLRRLGELLKKRQHSGLDTGSLSPSPTRDNS